MKKSLITAAASFAFAAVVNAQDALPQIIDEDLTLEAFSEHKLVAIHYVAPGATLTIEEGVTIYADVEGVAAEAPALIVTAGATINAIGTADAPIVFTSTLAQTETLDHNDVGLWAGVIVLGNASINSDVNGIASADGVVLQNLIEGIDANGQRGVDGATESSYLTYGGSDDADSSGTLRYVSIRHTGFALPGESGSEIQGLTLGGVGSGTNISFIEIFVSDDDGVEIFGGTVNLDWIAIAYAEDDSIDLDQGYRGTIQNVFVLQVDFEDETGASRDGDHGGEWDGADLPVDNSPASGFVVANATFVQAAEADGTNDTVIRIRNGGIGQLWNSAIVTNDSKLIRLDNAETDAEGAVVSVPVVENAVTSGDTIFRGNLFFSSADGATSFDLSTTVDINDFSNANAALATITDSSALNQFEDTGITTAVAAGGKAVVTIPSTGELYDTDNVVTIPSSVIPPLADRQYVGAFAANKNWADWTFLAEQGYLVVEGAEDSSAPSLVALSGRFQVEAGEGETIVGLILEEQATLAITAKGASIADQVSDALADPEVSLFVFDTETSAFVAYTGEVDTSPEGFPSAIAPLGTATNDEAIIATLPAGTYTINVSSGDGTAGIALVEAYDIRAF
ncbi:MAG: hypothetical protein AAF212_05840 [Verrucomicrobiota bacterium]